MQKTLPFIMNLRNRTKDVGLALLKLDKLPLQKLRKVGKSTVGGSKDSTPEDECEKCKHVHDKTLSCENDLVMRVSSKDKDDGQKDKLETIVEHPLVEMEPRVEGLDVPPKLFGSELFKQPLDRRHQKSFDMNKMKPIDEIACKLMKVPPSQIDAKLMDTCLSTRTVDFERSGTYPIVENLECDVMEHIVQPFDSYTEVDKDTTFADKYSNLTPNYIRSYDLNLESDSDEKTLKAENLHPVHLDVEFKMSIEKDILHDLSLHSFPLRQEFIAYSMAVPPPLPPNETSISSQMIYEDDIHERFRRDKTMPPYMREFKMGRRMQDPRMLEERTQESYENYLSTLSRSAAVHEPLGPRKDNLSTSKRQEIPLSELLRQVRQRNKIAQEMQKKKIKFDPRPFFSKSTCLPPLDLRPRSATCSPKPCPPRKKEAPPKKAMPCPPPKKPPCPPPKKGPCPVKSNPCDPCKPPPPCPPPKNPCGMYTGNKFKDTITLILCGFNPSNILQYALGLPLLRSCPHSFIKDSAIRTFFTNSIAHSKALGLKSKESSSNITSKESSYKFYKYLIVPDLGKKQRDIQQAYFSRSYSNNPVNPGAIQTISTTSMSHAAALGLKSNESSSKFFKLLKVPDLEKQKDEEQVYFARSYEPWAPIPSWPTTKKEKKNKLVCPKEGCKVPRLMPSKPCKEFPCSFKSADRKV
ncbi:PREDICTED: uncharacterized protein LOC106100036 [Papilio polytes]|uniref:uncharacterized protein LOC106100036 n=1 Tax=Papilio polytes TaxID=76194 RepID=UPI00067651FF|nr:PREDICTED: uncharacterized protein LOC106100036 [Papilio polytes]